MKRRNYFDIVLAYLVITILLFIFDSLFIGLVNSIEFIIFFIGICLIIVHPGWDKDA